MAELVGKRSLIEAPEAARTAHIEATGTPGKRTLTEAMAPPRATPRAPASTAAGAGAPLPDAFRVRTERLFGTNFAGVRVHEGPHVVDAGAEAYTQGADIHMAPGRYDPDSAAGQALLGHELAHVVQQASGRVAATGTAGGHDLNDDPGLEAEADAHAARAAHGEPVGSEVRGAPAPRRDPAGVIQRVRLKREWRHQKDIWVKTDDDPDVDEGSSSAPAVIETATVDLELLRDIVPLIADQGLRNAVWREYENRMARWLSAHPLETKLVRCPDAPGVPKSEECWLVSFTGSPDATATCFVSTFKADKRPAKRGAMFVKSFRTLRPGAARGAAEAAAGASTDAVAEASPEADADKSSDAVADKSPDAPSPCVTSLLAICPCMRKVRKLLEKLEKGEHGAELIDKLGDLIGAFGGSAVSQARTVLTSPDRVGRGDAIEFCHRQLGLDVSRAGEAGVSTELHGATVTVREISSAELTIAMTLEIMLGLPVEHHVELKWTRSEEDQRKERARVARWHPAMALSRVHAAMADDMLRDATTAPPRTALAGGSTGLPEISEFPTLKAFEGSGIAAQFESRALAHFQTHPAAAATKLRFVNRSFAGSRISGTGIDDALGEMPDGFASVQKVLAYLRDEPLAEPGPQDDDEGHGKDKEKEIDPTERASRLRNRELDDTEATIARHAALKPEGITGIKTQMVSIKAMFWAEFAELDDAAQIARIDEALGEPDQAAPIDMAANLPYDTELAPAPESAPEAAAADAPGIADGELDDSAYGDLPPLESDDDDDDGEGPSSPLFAITLEGETGNAARDRGEPEPSSQLTVGDYRFVINSRHAYKFHDQSLRSHPGRAGTLKEVELAVIRDALVRHLAGALPRESTVGKLADSPYRITVNGVQIQYLAWAASPGGKVIHIPDYMAVHREADSSGRGAQPDGGMDGELERELERQLVRAAGTLAFDEADRWRDEVVIGAQAQLGHLPPALVGAIADRLRAARPADREAMLQLLHTAAGTWLPEVVAELAIGASLEQLGELRGAIDAVYGCDLPQIVERTFAVAGERREPSAGDGGDPARPGRGKLVAAIGGAILCVIAVVALAAHLLG